MPLRLFCTYFLAFAFGFSFSSFAFGFGFGFSFSSSSFLKKTFPAPTEVDEEGQDQPMVDKFGDRMEFDREMAELAIAEVLTADMQQFDVTVGEAVASDTLRMAHSAEIKEISDSFPGLIPAEKGSMQSLFK